MKPSVKTQVLDAIAQLGKPVRFVDIQALIVAVTLKRPYRKTEDRGHWSSAIRSYFQKPGHEKRYLKKGTDGLYYLINK
jgi:hypothetical protein